MNKAESLVAEYAENRTRLSVVSKEISEIMDGIERIDLFMNDIQTMRKGHIDSGDSYGQGVYWTCWEDAVNGWDDSFSASFEVFQAIAILWDTRKKINREAGQIRRNMCAVGRGIIRRR